MRVVLISGAHHAGSGVGRYSVELAAALQGLGHEVRIVRPVVPLPRPLRRLARRLGWDLDAFFSTYPVWARYPSGDVYHLASQNLATLLVFRPPPGPTIVTVHDIIPWQTRNDPALRAPGGVLESLFRRLALHALPRADAVVADSRATVESLSGASHAR